MLEEDLVLEEKHLLSSNLSSNHICKTTQIKQILLQKN